MTRLAGEAADLLRRLAELGLRPYAEIGVLGARHAVEASRWMQGEKPAGVRTRDVLADGAEGRLPVRIYQPEDRDGSTLVVWFHGGGWVAGSVLHADRMCRAVARASGAVVASVEYRRPPETPFPGPLDDAEAATLWLAEHAAELGADADRFVVAGDSAGGNLAAAVARRRPDRVAHQVLVYPVLAPVDPGAYPSQAANATGYLLTRVDLEWFWEHYLAGAPPTADAAPLLADDLAGLPAASIAVAGFDPLHDEGVAYAERLCAAGVETTLRDWPGMVHGFLGMAGELAATAELVTWIGNEVRRTAA